MPADPAAPAEPTPVAPVPDPAAPPPLVMPAALGSWCETLFPSQKPRVEKRKAQELMAGKVDMGNGGTYYLSEHPNWRPQSGTDTSGDRHVHSLDWALPLLYRGVHKQSPGSSSASASSSTTGSTTTRAAAGRGSTAPSTAGCARRRSSAPPRP